MVEHEGSRSSDKMASLVLSIFKGENFVVKGLRTPCRVFLKAKCADLQPEVALESSFADLTSSSTEPEFHSQLAWSLSRKQLKELRSNRSIIKVTCFVVDRNGLESEVGYVVLHVKDATAFGAGIDVDPTKAATFPLLGTKDYWRAHQPKLLMVLHLEEMVPDKIVQNRTSSIAQDIKPPILVPSEPSKSDCGPEGDLGIKNAGKLSETKILPSKDTNKFLWTVKEKEGYFQLGSSTDEDDLYILNTTVISASYLHTLWDGRSPRKFTSDNFFWQVKYEAYGCEIASEPFLLGNDDESRRTFIGDKATARIRANGALFFEYLLDTNLQFQILRYQLDPNKELTNPEVMGICFAALGELTNPDKRELRVQMEIVSEWGTARAVSFQKKPEVRVSFVLEAIPNFFKVCASGMEGSNDICPTDTNPPTEADRVRETMNNQENPIIISSNDVEMIDERRTIEERGEDVPDSTSTVDPDVEIISNTSNARRLLQFEDETRETRSPNSSSSSPSSTSENCTRDKNFTAPKDKVSHASDNFSETEDSDTTNNKENLARIMPPPGDYRVTIQLNRFWLKSRRAITDNFLLSYTHPPLGISSKPIEFYSQAVEPDVNETRQGFIIPEGEYTKTVSITNFSESLLNDPLTVEFFRTNGETRSACFASAMLPFGRIFSEKDHNNVWTMEASSDILKIQKNIKIGTLFFKIKLVGLSKPPRKTDRKSGQRHSSFFPPCTKEKKQHQGHSTDACTQEIDRREKVTENMREWRHTQEEMFKRQKEEAETAYLKILSDEAAKRDAERENALAKKLAELEKKDKELNRQRKLLEDWEQKLKHLESELKDKTRKLELEQESLQHHSTLAQRRLEEDHKIEVEGLKRCARGFQDEAEKLKTKVLLLEKKLETKEAEIDNLMALKRELPDVRLEQRVSLLEQENKSLKTLLREANGRKEQYKKQTLALCQKLNRIQEERDQELKDQNENLRWKQEPMLQILASKEHKELKKERKAVQDLSQTLKALQKETVLPTHHDGKGDRVEIPSSTSAFQKSCYASRGDSHTSKDKEDEIKRLATERSKLLQTGAYTNYDSVIKELEKKMIALAQE